MPREKRQVSENGIYYVYAKGIFERKLTRSDFDKLKLVACVKEAKDKFHFDLYAFCVSNNELHLLLREKEPGDLSMLMKDILFNYTNYYNIKYDETGSLIYDRFKSRPVFENELNEITRYIHQTPMREKEFAHVFAYEYSSYKFYFIDSFVDRDFILSRFDEDLQASLTKFKIFHAGVQLESYKMPSRPTISDEAVEDYVIGKTKHTLAELASFSEVERIRYAKDLKKRGDLSLVQIGKACKLPKTTIQRL